MYWTSLCDFSREYHWVELDLYPHHLSQCRPHGQHAVNSLHNLSLTWAPAALTRLYRHKFKSLPHHFPVMCSGILLIFSIHMCKMVKTIGSLWQLQKKMYATLSPQYFTCTQQTVQFFVIIIITVIISRASSSYLLLGISPLCLTFIFLMTFILLDTMRSWEIN